MTIDTCKFSKRLIMFLFCNIMIIFTVSCDKTYGIVPDFDMIQKIDQGNYFKYYSRSSKHVGQLKIHPQTFFKSVHNCDYLILPELDDPNDYGKYVEIMKDINFQSVYNKYHDNYDAIKKQENEYVEKFEESTKAFDEIIKYESQPLNARIFTNKKIKEGALEFFKNNQMPDMDMDMSENTFSNEYCSKNNPAYTYKNYEIFADSTEEVYYCSNILQAEYNAVMNNGKIKTCEKILTEAEYNKVLFLYALLDGTIITTPKEFTLAKIDLYLHLQNTLLNLPKTYTREELIHVEKDDPDDYTSTINMLKNEFVVNNENYMSYLVRQKILGNIGFHIDYHKHLYRTRADYKLFNSNPEINYDENTNGIDIDIHTIPHDYSYPGLVPFDPEDI